MKTFFFILALIFGYQWYDASKELEQMKGNSEIDFFLSYQVASVEKCSIDGCSVKVKRKGEILVKPATVTTFEAKSVPLDTKVYRVCTADLKSRTVKCSRDLKLIEHVDPKYIRHPDWDLRPVAETVIYE